jgi:hypothetical protein
MHAPGSTRQGIRRQFQIAVAAIVREQQQAFAVRSSRLTLTTREGRAANGKRRSDALSSRTVAARPTGL